MTATWMLGDVLLQQKRFAEVDALLSPAESAARIALIGSDERDLAGLSADLGQARAQLGQFVAAEANLIEAHAIRVKIFGAAHAAARRCVQHLVDFLARWDRAEPGDGHDAKIPQWRARLEDGK